MEETDSLVRKQFYDRLIDISNFIKKGKEDGSLKPNLLYPQQITITPNIDYSVTPVNRLLLNTNMDNYWYQAQQIVYKHFSNSQQILGLKKLLMDEYQLPIWFGFEAALDNFISTMMLISWDDDHLKEAAEEAVKYLKREPFTCSAFIELVGIKFKNQGNFDLGNGITMRNLTDFEERSVLVSETIGVLPSAIIDIDIPASNKDEIMDKIRRIDRALKLFQISSIQTFRFEIYPIMLDPYFGGDFPKEILHVSKTRHYCFIDQSNMQDFKKLFNIMINNTERLFSTDSEDIFVKTAYEKYVESLQSDYSGQITNAIIGLDAIFLKNERSPTLAKRAACLMERFGKDFSNIESKIKEAFKVRNAILHGDYVKNDDPKLEHEQEMFAYEIMEILRITIIVLLTSNVTKGEFISSLKKSLENDHDDLNETVAITKKITYIKKRPRVIVGNGWFSSRNEL